MSLFEYKPTANTEDLFFWLAIDISNLQKNAAWDMYDIDEHLKNLTLYLSKLKKEKLIIFEKILQRKLVQLYTPEIVELFFILNSSFIKNKQNYKFECYLSDDAFIYFRCWLILKGKDFFDDIRSDINTFLNGNYCFNIGDCWAEGLLYCSDEAYLLNHNSESETPIGDEVYNLYPENHYDSGQFILKRKPFEGNELQIKYPKLVKEICSLRE